MSKNEETIKIFVFVYERHAMTRIQRKMRMNKNNCIFDI